MKVFILTLGLIALASARSPHSRGNKLDNAMDDFNQGAKDIYRKIDQDIRRDVDEAQDAIRNAIDKLKNAREGVDNDLTKIYEKARDAVMKIIAKINDSTEEAKEQIVNDINTKLEFLKKIIELVENKIEEWKEDILSTSTLTCNGTECELCRIIPAKFVSNETNENATVCFRTNFDLEQGNIELKACVDETCYLDHVFKMNETEPICVQSSKLPISGCIRPYAFEADNETMSMCVANDIKFKEVNLATINLNCLEIVNKQHVYLTLGELPSTDNGIFKFDGADLVPSLRENGTVLIL